MIMKLLPARCPKKIAAIFSIGCLAAGLVSAAPATALLTVQIVGTGTVSPNYNGQLLNVGQKYSLTAKAKSDFTFTGWTGSQTSSKPKLSFVMADGLTFTATFVDKQKPTLSIKTPPNSGALPNAAITVTGTAKDNDAVATVFCNLNGQGWQPALTGNGWNNWWVNLTNNPNTNVLLAYAVDRSGNCSKTNSLKMTYSAAPSSLNGMTMTVTKPDSSIYVFSFGSGTFSEDMGVGSYAYKKTGAVAGKISLKYIAPPTQANATNDVTVLLQFTDASSGTFTDDDGLNSFSLSTADSLAPPALTGSQIFLTYSNDNDESILDFLTPPQVADNGSLFDVANPLVITLASQYPGEIADRVAVTFTHVIYFSGAWTAVAPQVFTGTVIDIGTNAVTVLFDNSGFLSKKDLYGPTVGVPLDILTYYYTNYFGGNYVTNGTGTFTYTNYSPAGSQLQLSQADGKGFYILTFTNDSDSGNFYVENFGEPGNVFQNTGSGSFAIELPPLVTSPPQNVGVTNGGTANFYITASGTPPLTFQWQKVGSGNLTDGTDSWGSVISGSSTTNLTITGVTNNDLGNYQIVITNIYGSVTSSVANLSFALPPQITSQPNSSYPASGGTAIFSVTATGSPTLAYQWQMNGTNLTDKTTSWGSVISGSLAPQLNISNVGTNDSGYYQVIVTNNFGNVTSTPAQLTVQ